MLSLEEIKHKTPEEIVNFISKLHHQLQSKDQENNLLRQRLNALLQHRYGRRSERLPEGMQGYLFNEAELPKNTVAIKKADEEITVASHLRVKSGRKPLPNNLPRLQKIYDLEESQKKCTCGCALTKIGEEKTEQLEFIPARVQVIEHIRLKYACKRCEETIKLAPLPLQPIPKSIATAGLLSHMIVSKIGDHLPLYRQEYILQRMGIDIPRCTMSHWFIRCANLLTPLIGLMREMIISYDVGYADETVLQVLKEADRPAVSKSYMWLFIGGPPLKRCFIYDYHPSRSSEVAKQFWQNFKGYLHCDGYQGYHVLFDRYEIKGVQCWAHARRKFFEITNTSAKDGLACWAVTHIAKLYGIEKMIKEKSLNQQETYDYRQAHAKPLLNEFKGWLEEHVHHVPPQSPLSKAMLYCLNDWENLMRYIDDGRLEIDNNRTERSIKPFVCGRKNWLFSHSVEGAKASAILYSLLETCKAHSVEPYNYFKEVLSKIMHCQSNKDYEKLLPFNFS